MKKIFVIKMLKFSVLKRTITTRTLFKNHKYLLNVTSFIPRRYTISNNKNNDTVGKHAITKAASEPKSEIEPKDDDESDILFFIICLWLFLIANKMNQ